MNEVDTKTFQNPTGAWSYDGGFFVKLTDDAVVPENFSSLGTLVSSRFFVEHGRVEQSMGGMQKYSRGRPFYFGYRWIKNIRKTSGDLIWVNNNYR